MAAGARSSIIWSRALLPILNNVVVLVHDVVQVQNFKVLAILILLILDHYHLLFVVILHFLPRDVILNHLDRLVLPVAFVLLLLRHKLESLARKCGLGWYTELSIIIAMRPFLEMYRLISLGRLWFQKQATWLSSTSQGLFVDCLLWIRSIVLVIKLEVVCLKFWMKWRLVLFLL
jgi:hypothetical protein